MKHLTIADIDCKETQAIVFDLDGTLYNKRFLPMRLLFSDLKHCRLLLAERQFRKQHYGEFFGSKSSFYNALYQHIAKKCGITVVEAEQWYEDKYMPLTIDILKNHYKVASYCVPLLFELQKQGIKLAVLSDYGYVEEKMQAIGLSPVFFKICASCPDMGGLKPNQEVMQMLLQKLNTEPEHTLMIGDRFDTDGLSAQRCGIKFLKV